MAETKKNVKRKIIRLTQKGKEVFKHMVEIGELLDEEVEDSQNVLDKQGKVI